MRTLAGSALYDVVAGALLAAMQRAAYAPGPGIHFGLGKDCYCHFTSPIRRYPDLVVHQQLLARDLGLPQRSADECGQLAGQCSAAEQNNDEAYYAAVDRLKLCYLRDLAAAGQVCHEGVVARSLAHGLVVYLPELCVYGVLPKTRRAGDRSRSGTGPARWQPQRSVPTTYKCGDTVFVELRRADLCKGELELQPVQPRIRVGRTAEETLPGRPPP
jgi:ribonuclease R